MGELDDQDAVPHGAASDPGARAPIGPTLLDGFVDGATARSRFSVQVRPLPDLPHVDGVLVGAAEVDLTPPPGHAQGRLLGQRPRRQRLPHPPAGPGHAPASRDGRRWRSCSATCSPGPRSSSTWSPRRSPSAPTSRSPGSGSVPPTPTPGPASSSAPTSTTTTRRTGGGFDPAYTELPGGADRRRGDRGPRHPGPGQGRGRQHRGVGAHPQPVARPARPEPHRHRQAASTRSASGSRSTRCST